MSIEGKVFVSTKCIDVGGRHYCIYCRGEVIPERDYENEHEDNYRYPCSCDGALKNDRLEREAKKSNQSSERLKELQAQIPNFINELMVLQEEERSKKLQRRLDQEAHIFSFTKHSQQPASQPE